jgi:hypothetical protein
MTGTRTALSALGITAPRGTNVTLRFEATLPSSGAVFSVHASVAVRTCRESFEGGVARAGSATECTCARGWRTSGSTRPSTGIQPSGAAALCVRCPAGSDTALDGLSECTCIPGFARRSAEDPTCVPCAQGSFSLTHGATRCECDAGHYFSTQDASCLRCPDGSFKNTTGPEPCTCDVGFWRSGSAEAVAQRIGKAGFDEETMWTAAAAATVVTVANASSPSTSPLSGMCRPCAAGSFKNSTGEGLCTCLENFFRPAGALECSPCPSGTTRPYSTYQDAGDDSLSCGCREGFVPDQLALDGSCVPCSENAEIVTGAPPRVDTQCVCLPGYTGTGLSCSACPLGTSKSVSGNGRCLCLPGWFLDDARGECVVCPVDHYSAEDDSRACTRCPPHSHTSKDRSSSSSSSVDQCLCDADYFLVPGPECAPCVEGALCPGGIEPPRAQRGYWAADASSLVFVKCSDEVNSCSGGALGAGDMQCREGYRGLVCEECAAGYGRVARSCAACRPVRDWAILIVTVAAFGLVLAFLVRSAVRERTLPMVVLRSVLDYLQVSFFIGSFGFDFPSIVLDVVMLPSSISTAGSRFIPLDCTLGWQADDIVTFYAALGLGLFIAVLAVGTLNVLLTRRPPAFLKVLLLFVTVSLVTLHPAITVESVQGLLCRHIATHHVLVADVRVSCDTARHARTRSLAVASLLLFSLGGIIVLLSAILTALRHTRRQGGQLGGGEQEDGDDVRPVGSELQVGGSGRGTTCASVAESVAGERGAEVVVAKTLGDNAQGGGDHAQGGGDNAQGGGDNAQEGGDSEESARRGGSGNISDRGNSRRAQDPSVSILASTRGSRHDRLVDVTTYLTAPFASNREYWGLVPLARKTGILCVAVFVSARPALAASLASLILTANIAVNLQLRPYREVWAVPPAATGAYRAAHKLILRRLGGPNGVDTMGLCANLITLTLGAALADAPRGSTARAALVAAVLAANTAMFAVAAVVVFALAAKVAGSVRGGVGKSTHLEAAQPGDIEMADMADCRIEMDAVLAAEPTAESANDQEVLPVDNTSAAGSPPPPPPPPPTITM